MGKMQRTKGAAFERAVATALAAIWPRACRGLAQCRNAREQADVERTPYWVECKVGAKPNVLGAYDQAKAATDGRPVLVVTKVDRHEPLVTMSLAQFVALSSKATERAQGDDAGMVKSLDRDPT